jgi:acyl-CoA synthetase (AMP-forming)/AMP-acid ligase II
MNLSAAIFRYARMQPRVAAIIEGERIITYGELAESVLRTAGHLANFGVVRSDKVGLCLKDDSQHVITLLAVAYLGATAVQIDSRSRPTERARMHFPSGSQLQLRKMTKE